MPEIVLKNISNFICRNINLTVRAGELMVILGPTGAGKTTLLNTIAGLTDYEGHIFFDGKVMDRVPAHLRNIGYLFQEPALFPHLDVRANVAYGLRVRGASAHEITGRVDELLDLMRIKHLTRCYPKRLSGGEKQRAALARALAPSPNVLLLDEPFSSLDFRTARILMTEIRRIQKVLGITTIYVTHNLLEAREMADRIGVIFDGEMAQVGPPREVFLAPGTGRVSDFLVAPNVLNCEAYRVLRHGLVEARCGGIRIVAPHDGKSVHQIVISPIHVHMFRDRPPGPDLNRFRGMITDIVTTRFAVRCNVRVAENNILAELPPEVFDNMELRVGSKVFLVLKLKWLRVVGGSS